MQLRKNIVSLVLAMQCLLNKRHFVSRILGIETKIYYDKHVIFGITVKVCFIFSSPVNNKVRNQNATRIKERRNHGCAVLFLCKQRLIIETTIRRSAFFVLPVLSCTSATPSTIRKIVLLSTAYTV